MRPLAGLAVLKFLSSPHQPSLYPVVSRGAMQLYLQAFELKLRGYTKILMLIIKSPLWGLFYLFVEHPR